MQVIKNMTAEQKNCILSHEIAEGVTVKEFVSESPDGEAALFAHPHFHEAGRMAEQGRPSCEWRPLLENAQDEIALDFAIKLAEVVNRVVEETVEMD